MNIPNLAIFEWKFPNTPGITIMGGEIVEWPKGIPRPTQADIDQWTSDYNNYQDSIAYQALREKAYPTIGNQLDAIWKQLNYDRLNGRQLIQEADDLLGQILQVKEDYPKPR